MMLSDANPRAQLIGTGPHEFYRGYSIAPRQHKHGWQVWVIDFSRPGQNYLYPEVLETQAEAVRAAREYVDVYGVLQ